MKNKPEVTIIILNHNGLKDTKECLESLLKTTYKSYLILLVDNGSLINEGDIIKRKFSSRKLKILRFNRNLGFAKGNNEAFKIVRSKYLVLLNNDMIISPEWLSELIKVAEKDEKIAACQPKIKSFFYPKFFEYAGGAGGFLDRLGYPYARGRIGIHLEEDVGQYDSTKEITWASGSCLLIKSKIFSQVGSLPEDFFFYHEETDLCLRLKRSGYKIMSVPRAVVWHKGAQTSKKDLRRRIFFVHRNALLLIARNFSLQTLIFLLPLRIILDWLSSGFYLLNGDFNFIFSVLLAHLSFLIKGPNIVKFRLSFKSKENINIEKQLFPVSIFWEYFFKKKRRFSEIIGPEMSSTKLMYYDRMFNLNNLIDNRKRIKKLFIK